MLHLELSSFFNYLLLLLIVIIYIIYNKNNVLRNKLKTLDKKYLSLQNKEQENNTTIYKLKEKQELENNKYTEKINSLYRFAEFGKLSAGLFHDIVNPLTAISLNLEHIDKKQGKFNKCFLKEAIQTTKKMQNLVYGIKKQINYQEKNKYFNINHEIEECLSLLKYKARKNNVRLIFKNSKGYYLLGLDIKFNQIILNLISNAIDSYKNIKRENNRIVIVKSTKKYNGFYITIQDFGEGIRENNQEKIFDEFYSTKGQQNNGLGLYCTKYNIEKYFQGKLIMNSKFNQGTKMTIFIDTKKTKHKNKNST